MDRANLSAAFSIKDLNGTDLIVFTTYDRQQIQFNFHATAFRVSCRFRNPLVTGRYLLAGPRSKTDLQQRFIIMSI